MLIHGGSRKGRGTTNKIANIHRIIEKAREFQKNNYFSFSDYAKAFDYVNHNKLWKILQKMGIPDHLTCLPRNLYVKAVYGHPAYLTYMQSTSCKMPGWMKHKLESRLPGEISVTSDTQMTPPLWQRVKRN